jgi:hypothetical protein
VNLPRDKPVASKRVYFLLTSGEREAPRDKPVASFGFVISRKRQVA